MIAWRFTIIISLPVTGMQLLSVSKRLRQKSEDRTVLITSRATCFVVVEVRRRRHNVVQQPRRFSIFTDSFDLSLNTLRCLVEAFDCLTTCLIKISRSEHALQQR